MEKMNSHFRCYAFSATGLLVLSFIVLFETFIRPELAAQQKLKLKLAEYKLRAQYMKSLYRSQQLQMTILAQYLYMHQSDGHKPLQMNVLLNDNESKNVRTETLTRDLVMPIAYDLLPNLSNNPDSIKPAYLLSELGKENVTIVYGIRIVRNDELEYDIIDVLENLVSSMDGNEQNGAMIIVFISDPEMEYIRFIAEQIKLIFLPYIKNGLIEVISAPISYYPNHVKEHAKQNLDIAFLMTYAMSKGTYFVQLQGHMRPGRGFVTIMKKFAMDKTAENKDWLILDFGESRITAKMFKSIDLPKIITYFQMFFYRSGDEILQQFACIKVCSWSSKTKLRQNELSTVWIRYKLPIFLEAKKRSVELVLH